MDFDVDSSEARSCRGTGGSRVVGLPIAIMSRRYTDTTMQFTVSYKLNAQNRVYNNKRV